MTSNLGTEYINLKQAKYNRTMSQRRDTTASSSLRQQSSTARVQRNTSSVCERTSFAKPIPHAAHAAAASASGDYVRTARSSALPKTGEGRYDDGLWSDIADSVGKAIAAKRKEKARARAEEAKYVKKSVKAATPLPISLIGYMVVFAAIAMFLVLGNTRINEATLRADALKSSLSAEKERAELLSSALSERKDIGYIENYAENVLGMVKSTDVAKHYVRISGEDKIAVCGTNVAVHTDSTDNADPAANRMAG